MKKGLCLAGGGVKGAAHIGAIKALDEAGIKFEYIGGTSSGSIVASLYACGFTADEMYEIFKKYCKKIKYVDLKNVIKLILDLIFTGKIKISGLNSGKQIEKLINKFCNPRGVYNIKDVKKKLIIPSVDLCNGEVICFTSVHNIENKKVVHDKIEKMEEEMQRKNDINEIKIQKRGNISDKIRFVNDMELGKAVRASCSYPVVFEPCPYKDTKLVDGGIRENVPWKELKHIGANKVISIIFEDDKKVNCNGNLIDVAERSISLLGRELSNYELDGAGVVIKIKSPKVGLLDMSKIDELYKLGYEQMKNAIQNGSFH